ncbi:NUDIX hydrolase [Clostridium sp. Marseille-P2415]|uniref:NUDIX hydrolase n=1 Tax=Clostridium sp. Marseille-P2415 TaxID=1805471 RepID=UPI0009889048|nr:8-oxo-dGTP diphosphatase [Clostridium sp. Marseille-P2415]
MAHKNLTTLCYIEQEDSYLMLHRIKKKGDMNQDKWLGVGGHFEDGESPEECLLREVKEETGLFLTSYKLRGVVTFVSDRFPDEYMFLFTADGYEGTMIDCAEGQLLWVEKEKTGELSLWEGDRIFFGLLKDNIPFFSLKLAYKGECLSYASLNGAPLELPHSQGARKPALNARQGPYG